jgi:hypothetical protein
VVIRYSETSLPIMFSKGREKQFLGLKGLHLNVAIGLIAGLDFLYDSLPRRLPI